MTVIRIVLAYYVGERTRRPLKKHRQWRVERDFINSIDSRFEGGQAVRFWREDEDKAFHKVLGMNDGLCDIVSALGMVPSTTISCDKRSAMGQAKGFRWPSEACLLKFTSKDFRRDHKKQNLRH